MKFVYWTFEDSTPEIPHFEINVFFGDEWAGHYQRRGEWIENIFVNEDMRGKGLCKEMMRHAIENEKQLRLFVRNNNYGAIRCYESVGFKPRTTIGDMVLMHQSSFFAE